MSATNFAAWLYRPYLDLSAPHPEAPLHTFGVEFDFQNMEHDARLPRIQSVLMPSYRTELIRECRMGGFAVDDPFSLDERHQSDRWRLFCTKLEQLATLDRDEQSRVLWLLNKLCFYGHTQALEFDTDIADNPHDAEVAYIFALARYTLSLERKQEYTLARFEEIAVRAPANSFAKVNASYQMIVQNVKHGYNTAEVEKWLPIHYANIMEATDKLGEFNTTRMLSRYYRVAGFLPQMKKDLDGMVRIMQLAEDHALRLFSLARERSTQNAEYHLAAREMIYPVLESRIKEALALEDVALAEHRARRLVEENPNEPRARLHLGQILIEAGKIDEAREQYLTAAELGPPGSDIALFMAGQCYQAAGDEMSALRCYKRSLHYDPLAVSPLEALQTLNPDNFLPQSGLTLVAEWAHESHRLVSQKLNSRNPLRDVQAYQKRQFDQNA